jgi:hypothetical protein
MGQPWHNETVNVGLDLAELFAFFGWSIWEEGVQVAWRNRGQNWSICEGVIVFHD